MGGDIRIFGSNAAGRGEAGRRKANVGFEIYSLLAMLRSDGTAENHGFGWSKLIASLRICRGK